MSYAVPMGPSPLENGAPQPPELEEDSGIWRDVGVSVLSTAVVAALAGLLAYRRGRRRR